MALLWCTGIDIGRSPFHFCWSGLNKTLNTMAARLRILIAVADDLQYDLFYLTPIVSGQILKMHLSQTAYFVVIPRMLVHSLNAVSLISPPQPSLFEGSNTGVEKENLLGKPILLSGIPVSLGARRRSAERKRAGRPVCRNHRQRCIDFQSGGDRQPLRNYTWRQVEC